MLRIVCITKSFLQRGIVLDKLDRDPRLLVKELDWVAKRHMIEPTWNARAAGGMIRARS
jgi:proteasome accessory factor A